MKNLGAIALGLWLGCASTAQGAFVAFAVDCGGFSPVTGGSPIELARNSQYFLLAAAGNSADASGHNVLAPFLGAQGAGVGMVGIQSRRPTHVPFTDAPNLGFPDPVNSVNYVPQDQFNTITPLQIQGYWYSTVQVPSGPPVSADGMAAVWLGRIGVTAGGGVPVLGLYRIAISETGVHAQIAEVEGDGDNAPCLDTFCDQNNPPLSYFYRIVYVPAGGNAQWDVYDITLEQFVPSPGPAALLAVSLGFCLGANRRRR